MKYFLILFVVAAGCLFVISGRGELTVKTGPDEQVIEWFTGELELLQAELGTLKDRATNGEESEALQEQFLSARLCFKRIEHLLFYLDPEQFNLSINGAPLPKLQKKVPGIVVLEPSGFQRIEEVLYSDEYDVAELKGLLEDLLTELGRIGKQGRQRLLSDPVIFEAVRYGIIRINSMGITGFDSPGNPDKSLAESAAALEGLKKTMNPYGSYAESGTWQQLETLCEKGIALLQKGDFNTFDRASFHRSYSDPLWKITLKMQQELRIELPGQRNIPAQAVEYTAGSLFADNFLRASYYAEYTDREKDEQRISLGRLLFFDPVLSSTNNRACASCHFPERAFTDGLQTSLITGTREGGKRNAPTLINAVFSEKFFHDLRVDRLSSQMDHVVLNPDEFATSYDTIVTRLRESEEYRSLFGEAYGVEGITRNTINNAITRYVASLRSFNSEFDRYMRKETNSIDPAVIRGFNLFAGKAGCATCHFAPTFAGLVPPFYTESESEVLGVPEKSVKPYTLDPDLGRYANHLLQEQVPFYRHSFKTPSLRNVDLTGPYMHNGVFKTLEEVVTFYNDGGGIGNGLQVEHQTLPSDSLKLTKAEEKDLVRFMKALTDTTGLTTKPARLPHFEKKPALNRRKIGGEY